MAQAARAALAEEEEEEEEEEDNDDAAEGPRAAMMPRSSRRTRIRSVTRRREGMRCNDCNRAMIPGRPAYTEPIAPWPIVVNTAVGREDDAVSTGAGNTCVKEGNGGGTNEVDLKTPATAATEAAAAPVEADPEAV